MNVRVNPDNAQGAVLDEAHIGHIHGAFGTILHGDVAPRETWKHRLVTLMAILGPGLIVMAGDNDAGAFATYGQAGQNYGTTLLWTMALLIPVLYVNQEMVLRLGAVTGVGHARLIFERFGKFWGAFSVIDLFLLNALTIITEFIGIALALNYLGLDKTTGVVVSAALIMIAVSTGNFRRFERFAMVLVFASLLLIPIYFMVHPSLAQVARDLVVPQIPAGKLSDVMLIIIGLVGTTVAPWQLFFQQSYVSSRAMSSTSASPRASSAMSGSTCGSALRSSSSARSRSSPSPRRPLQGARSSVISPTQAESPPGSRNMSAGRRA